MVHGDSGSVTHTMLMVAVMVYPTMVPHRFTYCAIPHMNTSLGPATRFPGIAMRPRSKTQNRTRGCAVRVGRGQREVEGGGREAY